MSRASPSVYKAPRYVEYDFTYGVTDPTARDENEKV